jgi:AraC-like DNA-binding protein
VLTIEYNHTHYDELLKHYAKHLKSKYKNGELHLNPLFGSGFMKLLALPNGLQAIQTHYQANVEMLFKRKKTEADFYTLRFDEAGDEVSKDSKSAVFLNSTRFDWLSFNPKNAKAKGISILFSKEWVENFLGAEDAQVLIKKFLSLKTSSFNYEPMDAEYKKLVADIFEATSTSAFEKLIVQNRIMLLLERFFTRIHQKMYNLHFEVKISQHDIDSLKEVEKRLVKDFSIEAPSIAKMAKVAAMSPTKLKNVFKEIYGLPLYQYFQKHRMNKAKAMLLSRKYTVKQVGIEVGYTNLSNFAKAFKKSFDQLPSDLLGIK